MVKYINAEIFKLVRRKYLYILFAVIAAGELLTAGLWSLGNYKETEVFFGDGLQLGTMFLSTGLYLSLLIADIVFSDQHKIGTLKNEVSVGVSRTRIYLGKLISSEILGILFCAAVLIFYALVCRIVLPGGAEDAQGMIAFGFAILCALPLWMGALALANMLFFLMKSTTVAAFSFLAFLWLFGGVLNVLSFLNNKVLTQVASALYRVALTAPFDNHFPSVPAWDFFGWCLAVGVGWLVVTTVIGLLAFRKKEIK